MARYSVPKTFTNRAVQCGTSLSDHDSGTEINR
jgi:hypothetical protein